MMGTKDPDFPDAVAEGKYLAQQIGAELELIEGAGHYPQTEMPDETTPLVLDFLKHAVPSTEVDRQTEGSRSEQVPLS